MYPVPSAAPIPPAPGGARDLAETPVLARGAGQRVLVVAAAPDVAELLSTTLALAGYRVCVAVSGVEALDRVQAQSFDLAVVDVPLPDTEELIRLARRAPGPRPPVLLLTPYDSLGGLLTAPAHGWRDYVTKPFRVGEVLARMQGLLRGTGPGGPGDALRYADLLLDESLCRACRGTRTLDLTPAEYRLLRQLLLNAHQVLSKEQIGRGVWGDVRGANAIEQLVSRLRRKVDHDAPSLIHTRRGFGYWLGGSEGAAGVAM
ncbi:response regulator transcription factor [Streptomyces sp. NPDC056716]|uniref:response regulator transcription factor n=1 Tax=unclassified Streptomyces TaxID=2593676 RepID=UPI00368A2549